MISPWENFIIISGYGPIEQRELEAAIFGQYPLATPTENWEPEQISHYLSGVSGSASGSAGGFATRPPDFESVLHIYHEYFLRRQVSVAHTAAVRYQQTLQRHQGLTLREAVRAVYQEKADLMLASTGDSTLVNLLDDLDNLGLVVDDEDTRRFFFRQLYRCYDQKVLTLQEQFDGIWGDPHAVENIPLAIAFSIEMIIAANFIGDKELKSHHLAVLRDGIENLAGAIGQEFKKPVIVNHADNLLNRPADCLSVVLSVRLVQNRIWSRIDELQDQFGKTFPLDRIKAAHQLKLPEVHAKKHLEFYLHRLEQILNTLDSLEPPDQELAPALAPAPAKKNSEVRIRLSHAAQIIEHGVEQMQKTQSGCPTGNSVCEGSATKLLPATQRSLELSRGSHAMRSIRVKPTAWFLSNRLRPRTFQRLSTSLRRL